VKSAWKSLFAVSGIEYLGFVEWELSIRSCSESSSKKQIKANQYPVLGSERSP